MKKPYLTYRDTDVPWIPKMPKHWDEVKVKFLFKERVEKGYEDEPLLAATQTQGVVPKELYETRTVTAQKDFHLLKLVEVGDFVISLRSFQGGIEYAYYRGIISPAYTIMKPLPEVFGGYFRYLFKSKHFIDDLATYVTGIREGQNIDYGKFRDSFQPIPSLSEQRQIADYLDNKCTLIDTFIQKKTRLIELLKEQKQAIINKAATRGIDPNALLKPSGIDWLGDIPEHWEVKKLKYLVKFLGGGTPSKDNPSYWKGSIPWISPKDMKQDEIEDSIDHISENAVLETSVTLVPSESVLIVVRGMILAHSFPTAINKTEATINQDMKALVCNKLIHPHYLQLFLKGMQGMIISLTSESSHGTKKIESATLKNINIFFPPISEQLKIVSKVNMDLKKVDHTVKRIKHEIRLAREYKTTLIAEAVTGKIDVRDWQPKQTEEETEQTLNQISSNAHH